MQENLQKLAFLARLPCCASSQKRKVGPSCARPSPFLPCCASSHGSGTQAAQLSRTVSQKKQILGAFLVIFLPSVEKEYIVQREEREEYISYLYFIFWGSLKIRFCFLAKLFWSKEVRPKNTLLYCIGFHSSAWKKMQAVRSKSLPPLLTKLFVSKERARAQNGIFRDPFCQNHSDLGRNIIFMHCFA